MITLAEIKKDLPANESDCGWPPPEPLGTHRWGRILGGRPLSWWKEVTWKKETVNCSLASLSDKSRPIVQELSDAFTRKSADAITTRRIKDAYIHIMDNACFPKPVLMMRVSSGLSVLDGSHRMAAFYTLQMTPDAAFKKLNKQKAAVDQEAWIGTHSASEELLT